MRREKKSDIINAIDSIKQDLYLKKKEIFGKITKIHTLQLF